MQQYSRIPREGTFAFGAFSASPSTLIRELKRQFDLPRPGVVAGFGPYRVVKDVESPPSWPAHRRETLPKTPPTGTVHFPPLAHPGLAVADAQPSATQRHRSTMRQGVVDRERSGS